MSADKYLSIFSRQMEPSVYLLLRSNFNHESNPVLSYQDISGTMVPLLSLIRDLYILIIRCEFYMK